MRNESSGDASESIHELSRLSKEEESGFLRAIMSNFYILDHKPENWGSPPAHFPHVQIGLKKSRIAKQE